MKLLDELVKEKKEKCIKNETLFLKTGTIRLSQKVFAYLIKSFIQLFDGERILNNNSLLDNKDFGKQILRKEITIKNIPSNDDFDFDSEGMETKVKVLIENGILTDCLNNLKSCIDLNCKAGNSQYDYFLGCCVNKCDKILFEYNNKKKTKYDDYIYLFDMKDTQLSIDGDTGYISLHLLGRRNNEEVMNYHLCKNIFDLFNSIVDVCGKQQEYSDCIVQEVVMDLREDKSVNS